MLVSSGKNRCVRRPYRSRQELAGLLRIPGVIFLCGLVIALSACSLFPTPSQSGSGADATVTAAVTPTQAPVSTYTPVPITLSVSGCPTLSENWDQLVATQAHVNKVQQVICGSLEGSGSLTALVKVRYYTPDAKLDFYVYDNLYGTPGKRFAVQGLLNGDAKLSPTNTIITAEATPGNSTPAQPNLFKEYQWNGSGFAQIMFPGIFPDMTNYQAQQSQAAVNANPTGEAWRTSGFGILDRLTHNIFHWPQTTNQVVFFNASLNSYIVQALNAGPGGGGVVATLFRLDNGATNIFEIKQLTPIDKNLSLNGPAAGTQLTSPLALSATYTASSGILGRGVLYDNTYFASADTGPVHGSATSGTASFSSSLPFHLDSKGVREAVVAFYTTNQNNIAFSNDVVLVKVLVSA